jgi:hypothetical protein
MSEVITVRKPRPEISQAKQPYEFVPIIEVEGIFTELYGNFPRYRGTTGRGGGHVTREAVCPHGPVEESTWLPTQEPFIQRTKYLLNKLINGSIIEHDAINHKDSESSIPGLSDQIVSNYLNLPLPFREDDSVFQLCVNQAVADRYSWFAYYYPNLAPALRAFLHVAGAAGTEVAVIKVNQYLRNNAQEPDRHYERMCKSDMDPGSFIGKHMEPHSLNIRCGGENIAASLIRNSHDAAVKIKELMDAYRIPAYEIAYPKAMHIDPSVTIVRTLDLQFVLVHSLDYMIGVMKEIPQGRQFGIPAREWVTQYVGAEDYNPNTIDGKRTGILRMLLSRKFKKAFNAMRATD